MRYAAVKFTSGGRIGHRFKDQTTARIACQLYGLTYLHTPYPDHDVEWNQFLGFGQGELLLDEIRDCRIVNINTTAWCGLDLDYVDNIVKTNPGENIVFLFTESARIMLEQLNSGDRQCIINLLRNKYQNSRQRFSIQNYFDEDTINVALHVRRGPDVDPKSKSAVATWRYTDISYYQGVIHNLRKLLPRRPVFHIFSQGDLEDFKDFQSQNDIHFHLVPFPSKNPYRLFQSFDHMLRADIFVTAVSAFSYMVSYLNPNQIINLPVRQVVSLPKEKRTILSQQDGSFDEKQFIDYWSK